MDTTYFLLYCVIALFSVLLYLIRRNLNYWKDRGILHDEPNIFSGNMQGVGKTRLTKDVLIETYKKYKGTGPFCGFYFFHKPTAFVLDTELAKTVLIKNFSSFADRGFFHNERVDPLTGNLFTLDGIKWKQMRHKLSPTFTSGKMKYMFPTVAKVGERFANIVGQMIEKDNVLEWRELTARYTTDVIGNNVFGVESNCLKDPQSKFREMGKKSIDSAKTYLLWIAFLNSFPKLSRVLRLRQTERDVENFFMELVSETIQYREKHNVRRNDFMDLLMDLKNNKTIKTDDGEEIRGLTFNELVAQAFVFYVAGFETSATTMGFLLYELARHQDIQNKVRDEINDVLEKHNTEFTYEAMKDLQYMDQVFSETLRLYTIIANVTRQALEDFVVPDHPKFVIEKGTQVMIPCVAFHHDPEIYPEPYKFDPDRFSPEEVAKRDSVEWLAFGDGPRNCIGMRFAQMQSRIGLTYLLKNYKFMVCEKTQIPLNLSDNFLSLMPQDGIYLHVEKI